MASPGLLAYVVTSKLADTATLLLYRLEQIFARQQVNISRSTLCGWMAAAGARCRAAVAALHATASASWLPVHG